MYGSQATLREGIGNWVDKLVERGYDKWSAYNMVRETINYKGNRFAF